MRRSGLVNGTLRISAFHRVTATAVTYTPADLSLVRSPGFQPPTRVSSGQRTHHVDAKALLDANGCIVWKVAQPEDAVRYQGDNNRDHRAGVLSVVEWATRRMHE